MTTVRRILHNSFLKFIDCNRRIWYDSPSTCSRNVWTWLYRLRSYTGVKILLDSVSFDSQYFNTTGIIVLFSKHSFGSYLIRSVFFVRVKVNRKTFSSHNSQMKWKISIRKTINSYARKIWSHSPIITKHKWYSSCRCFILTTLPQYI